MNRLDGCNIVQHVPNFYLLLIFSEATFLAIIRPIASSQLRWPVVLTHRWAQSISSCVDIWRSDLVAMRSCCIPVQGALQLVCMCDIYLYVNRQIQKTHCTAIVGIRLHKPTLVDFQVRQRTWLRDPATCSSIISRLSCARQLFVMWATIVCHVRDNRATSQLSYLCDNCTTIVICVSSFVTIW